MFIGISFTPVICGNNDVVYTTFRPDDSICSCNLLLGKYAVMTELPPRSDEVMNSMDNNSEPVFGEEDLPDSFSWLSYGGNWVTPAKNQQYCGSCWAFGALGAMESAIKIASGDPDWDPDLSEQYVLSCLPSAGSCNGGWISTALIDIKSADLYPVGNGINGCTIESCMPYKARDYFPCSDKCSDWNHYTTPYPQKDDKFFQIKDIGITSLDPSDPNAWITMKSWVYEHGPIGVDIYASNEWTSYWDSTHDPTAVYYGTETGTTNHAQVICGWVDTPNNPNYQGYWILKGSWGSYWGYNGFSNLAYGCLMLGDRDVAWVETTEWGEVPHVERLFAGWDYTPACPRPGEEILFTDGSTGSAVLWQWDFNGDGIIDKEEKNPEWIYNEVGVYNVTLTVWNSFGLNSILSKSLEVKEIWPPKAVVYIEGKPLPAEGYGGKKNVLIFDGRYSYDLDYAEGGYIVGYAWDFNGDNIIDSTEPYQSYTYPDFAGEYLASLTVTDNEDASYTKKFFVRIDIGVPPETSAVLGGIGGSDIQWFNRNTKVDFVSTDWSGVHLLYFKLDNESVFLAGLGDSWKDGVHCYSSKLFSFDWLVVKGHGIHVLDFYSVDIYGNEESMKTQLVGIDIIDPTFDIVINGNTFTLNAADVDSGIAEVIYSLNGIEYVYTGPFIVTDGSTYLFSATAIDVAGNTVTETSIITIEPGPNKPSISGSTIGHTNKSYNYIFTSTDPKDRDVSFYIEWGDGTTTGWTNFVSSGSEKPVSHTWNTKGSYTINAKVKNTLDIESDWIKFNVSITKSKTIIISLFLQKLINRFPIFEKILNQIT